MPAGIGVQPVEGRWDRAAWDGDPGSVTPGVWDGDRNVYVAVGIASHLKRASTPTLVRADQKQLKRAATPGLTRRQQ